VPDGWTRVRVGGRSYGVSRTAHAGGRTLTIHAEELGGTDVVSANVLRTAAGDVLKPCEMPAEKVMTFLREVAGS
jgi:hypothetical protein